jgi:hypothetical protein
MDTSTSIELLRVAVYRRFAQAGQAPTVRELAEQFGLAEASIRAGLRELAAGRHLVLDDQDRIVMAHPFSSVPLGFSVMGSDTLWWGGCAWDAFALPHLIPEQSPVLVATRCPNCERALAWNVGTDQAPSGTEVAHFLVPVAHMWDDVVHTCAHQRLFCSPGCVDQWLEGSGNTKGYVMDLSTLWRFASGWYTGRLDHGYRRREPSEAADYLRGVGLQGAFWGL